MQLKNFFYVVFFTVFLFSKGWGQTASKRVAPAACRLLDYIYLLHNKRVGVVANQSSIVFHHQKKDSLVCIVDTLSNLGVSVVKIFSPEHGFKGTIDAAVKIKDTVYKKQKTPVISLYGKHKKPTPEQLEHIDLMLFYIQDVGVRFYTYLSTLHYVMEACAESSIPLVLLDCPNPNAHYIDGPVLESDCKSFLGMHPVPLVYGMTIGEYAEMINGEGWLKNNIRCDLQVIPLRFYTHQTRYKLPIKPSPNLRNTRAIKLYPSLGLFDGTVISAGRGTSYPFLMWGAPWLKQYAYHYTPVPRKGARSPKFLNEKCYGVNLKNYKVKNEIELDWLIKAYRYTAIKVFFTKTFDLHAGNHTLQKQIKAGINEKQIKASWQKGLNTFKKIRAKYLLYP